MVAWVGVEGGEGGPEAFLDLEKNLMLTGDVEVLEEDSFKEERNIPLKLMRRGVLGGDSW